MKLSLACGGKYSKQSFTYLQIHLLSFWCCVSSVKQHKKKTNVGALFTDKEFNHLT